MRASEEERGDQDVPEQNNLPNPSLCTFDGADQFALYGNITLMLISDWCNRAPKLRTEFTPYRIPAARDLPIYTLGVQPHHILYHTCTNLYPSQYHDRVVANLTINSMRHQRLDALMPPIFCIGHQDLREMLEAEGQGDAGGRGGGRCWRPRGREMLEAEGEEDAASRGDY